MRKNPGAALRAGGSGECGRFILGLWRDEVVGRQLAWQLGERDWDAEMLQDMNAEKRKGEKAAEQREKETKEPEESGRELGLGTALIWGDAACWISGRRTSL